MVRWADGTEATLGEVQAGEFSFMSDDYEVVLYPGHTLYTTADFTNEEYERSSLAKMVIDGGLGICMKCGAGESELDEFATCREYNDHNRALRQREEAERRGLYWIDLQDLLEDADPTRPFLLIDHAADRLMLQVNEPDKVCVLTTSAHLRDVLAAPGRNPSGVEVLTTDMARSRGLPNKALVLLGHTRIGSLRNRFYRMVRFHQQKRGKPTLCIDSGIPPGLKRYAVASALGQASAIFGHYRNFIHRYFDVTDLPGRFWVGDFKPGADVSTAIKFFAMCDERFAGPPGIWKPESVEQNRFVNAEVYPK